MTVDKIHLNSAPTNEELLEILEKYQRNIRETLEKYQRNIREILDKYQRNIREINR